MIPEVQTLQFQILQFLACRQQGLEIGMGRCPEQALRRASLDHTPLVEHRDIVCQLRSQSDVVGDEDQGEPASRRQRPKQFDDGVLGNRIEGAGRLVRDQYAGLADQCRGEGDALLLAAGKLVRIFARRGMRVGQGHAAEPIPRQGQRVRAAPTPAGPARLGDLVAHRDQRVEAAARILKDHADIAPGPGLRRKARPGQPAGTRRIGRQQSCQGCSQGRFARSAFPQQSQMPAGLDIEVDALQGRMHAGTIAIGDAEAAQGEKLHAAGSFTRSALA